MALRWEHWEKAATARNEFGADVILSPEDDGGAAMPVGKSGCIKCSTTKSSSKHCARNPDRSD
jgi:hypothetical protein